MQLAKFKIFLAKLNQSAYLSQNNAGTVPASK